MTIQATTLATLERMFGPTRQIDDELERIETASLSELRSIIEHLSFRGRELLAELKDAGVDLSAYVTAKGLDEDIEWARTETDVQLYAIHNAIENVDHLVKGLTHD